MKKITFILLFNAILFSSFCQGVNHVSPDSVWVDGKYYKGSEIAKAQEREKKMNFESYFMPGLAYTLYQPKISDSLGLFSGIAVDYLIISNVNQTDNHSGPSHVQWYAKLNIMKSDRKEIGSMFMYTTGINLSFEKNPNRSFLIPFFGLEFGGMSQKQSGTTVQFTPTVGLHLLAKKNIYLKVHGGYVYPISNFENMQGWTAQAGLNFALW